MSKCIALVLEYNGANFYGWQDQPNLRTIQVELQKTLEMVLRGNVTHLHASGRTDSGVHAKCQVVTFRTDADVDLDSLAVSVSGVLRNEVAVVRAAFMPSDFHPRKSALWKRYQYTILHRQTPAVLDAGRAWHVKGALDIELMKREASTLVGVHDFKTFQAAGCAAKTSTREIFKSEIAWNAPHLTYTVEGEGFLKQMVRNIVGTLVWQGRGLLSLSMEELLLLKDRQKAGVTAPAHGLTLEHVQYEERFMELLFP